MHIAIFYLSLSRMDESHYWPENRNASNLKENSRYISRRVVRKLLLRMYVVRAYTLFYMGKSDALASVPAFGRRSFAYRGRMSDNRVVIPYRGRVVRRHERNAYGAVRPDGRHARSAGTLSRTAHTLQPHAACASRRHLLTYLGCGSRNRIGGRIIPVPGPSGAGAIVFNL